MPRDYRTTGLPIGRLLLSCIIYWMTFVYIHIYIAQGLDLLKNNKSYFIKI
jgi:hypothetical protein